MTRCSFTALALLFVASAVIAQQSDSERSIAVNVDSTDLRIQRMLPELREEAAKVVEHGKADGFAEEAKKMMASLQPIPRAGITDDIANAAVFLASDDSTFINGHDLVVDGGVVGGRMWTPHQEGVKAMRQAFGVDEI